MNRNQKPFVPEYAVHPGEILLETLEAKKMSGAELARRTGLTKKHISQIMNEKAPITPDTAIQLERILGISANIWNNLDAHYRLFIAKQSDLQELERNKSWADKFPVKELKKRGFLPAGNNAAHIIGSLLDFFGVGNINAWDERFKKLSVSFRHSPSYESSPESLITWLRIGEIFSDKIECNIYNEKLFYNALTKIRSLTRDNPELFIPKLINYCREAGVAVVFVRELPGTHVSGATRWLNSGKAMIILSLRHKRDDHFWFSFFHEAGHILFHGKKDIYIDTEENASYSEEEKKANIFAADFLIPKEKYGNFINALDYISKESVLKFAKKVGIAPGIIVGRLQYEGKLPFTHLNKLKRAFILTE